MPDAAASARDIARRAKSNLAFALGSLPAQRRQDMQTFYAFCRRVDDIADDEGIPVDVRRRDLDRWRRGVEQPVEGEEVMAPEVRAVRARHELPVGPFRDIIRGVESDLVSPHFRTVAEAEAYCHLVASVVGLVSIEIFGYRNPACREYARVLGLALQWTNILRDVGEDARRGRVYIPEEDLDRAGVTREELLAGRADARLRPAFEAVHGRAADHFQRAADLLPVEDKRSMVAAETMRKIYRELLEKMRRDGFRVMDRRYRLSKARMLWLLVFTRLGA